MSSLRHKITFGYAAIGALVVLLSVLSFLELRLLETRIMGGERIGEFFGLALEIRRFEKNYFLYRQEADLNENRAYVAMAQSLLHDQLNAFEVIRAAEKVAELQANLKSYAALMDEYRQATGARELLEARIRHIGKQIVVVAEQLSRTERRALQALLERHKQMLVASVFLLMLLVFAIGQWLSRRVSQPLKQLEHCMAAVAAGRLTKLSLPVQDREIVSLIQVFNHMMGELELRRGQLVHSEKLAALGTLLSGVAHELNNPLSNISTSCEILAQELAENGGTPFTGELLGQIDDETWRARRIVRTLLDYARDRAFHKEALPLAQLLDDTLRLVKGRMPAHVLVVRHIPEDLLVWGDKQRLQQVLFNLIGNAVEALEGAGHITIIGSRFDETTVASTRRQLRYGKGGSQKTGIEIEVRDDGHGIPATVLPKIFDPFFTTKEVGKGLGLGLFIVFEIVEEHGGCIAVESELGQGTRFIVRLPHGEA